MKSQLAVRSRNLERDREQLSRSVREFEKSVDVAFESSASSITSGAKDSNSNADEKSLAANSTSSTKKNESESPTTTSGEIVQRNPSKALDTTSNVLTMSSGQLSNYTNQCKETSRYCSLNAILQMRRCSMLQDLQQIFPIENLGKMIRTIRGLHLGSIETLQRQDPREHDQVLIWCFRGLFYYKVNVLILLYLSQLVVFQNQLILDYSQTFRSPPASVSWPISS